MIKRLREFFHLPQPLQQTAEDALFLYGHLLDHHPREADTVLAESNIRHVFLARILLAEPLAWGGLAEEQVTNLFDENPYANYVRVQVGYDVSGESNLGRLRADQLRFAMGMQQLRRQADARSGDLVTIRRAVVEAVRETDALVARYAGSPMEPTSAFQFDCRTSLDRLIHQKAYS